VEDNLVKQLARMATEYSYDFKVSSQLAAAHNLVAQDEPRKAFSVLNQLITNTQQGELKFVLFHIAHLLSIRITLQCIPSKARVF
jgi:hypothetical protein